MQKGRIFNIQKCSIHDGPGLRTLVFLKGCPLKCLWCANPESQRYDRELSDSPSKCIACGACLEKCPNRCLSLHTGGHDVDFALCNHCGDCTEVCYAKSLQMVGEDKTADELLDVILRDKRYYARSGGGVTFSGGEPLTQPEFLLEIGEKCRRAGIHVTIETCGCGSYAEFAPALEYVDLVFFDLKAADPERHRELTGASNAGLLKNLEAMDKLGKEIIIRIPLIPGCTDDEDNLIALAEIIKPLASVKQVELMPYHALGESKYAMLGRTYELKGVRPHPDQVIDYAVITMNRGMAGKGKGRL